MSIGNPVSVVKCCTATFFQRGIFSMRSKNVGRLEHQRKVLEKRAAMARMGEQVRQLRVKIMTTRTELKSLRGR